MILVVWPSGEAVCQRAPYDASVLVFVVPCLLPFYRSSKSPYELESRSVIIRFASIY